MIALISRLKFLLLLLTFCISNTFKAQNITGLDMLNNQSSIEIPFELIQGHIIVEMTFGGFLPLKFIFDSGAQHTVLFESSYVLVLGHKAERQIPIMGADLSDEVMAGVFRNVKMKLGPSATVNRDIIVLQENFLKLENILGINVVGMVGSDYFKNLILKIDYERNKIIVYDVRTANENKITNGFTEVNAKFLDGKIYVNADVTINNIVRNLKLLLDTGASLPLLINTGTDSLLQVPENAFSTILGYGLSGPIMGFLGKVNHLENEVFKMNNLVSYFQDDEYSIVVNTEEVRNGLIGNLTLSKYHIVINYFKQKVYFKQNKYYKKPIKFDLSGMNIQAYGKNFNEFFIKSLIKNGPSEKAGLMLDDEIVKIGNWAAWRYSLNRLTDILASKEGKIIKFKVRRDGKIVPITLKLENYLN